mmetsp:Transcript_11556/g.32441  ORF Transcript_11556/g.32441 Transcript_11556/m.32441 type:complete len:87 (+) Transcript_11556:1649-1909(+)
MKAAKAAVKMTADIRPIVFPSQVCVGVPPRSDLLFPTLKSSSDFFQLPFVYTYKSLSLFLLFSLFLFSLFLSLSHTNVPGPQPPAS